MKTLTLQMLENKVPENCSKLNILFLCMFVKTLIIKLRCTPT